VRKEYGPVFEKLGISAPQGILGSIMHTRVPPLSLKGSAYPELSEKTSQHFTSVYRALRQTHHEERQYTTEHKELLDLLGSWDLFRTSTLPNWITQDGLTRRLSLCSTDSQRKRITSETVRINDEVVKEYQGLIERSIQCFEGALHFSKLRILSRLYKMQKALPKTPEGRINRVPIDLQAVANAELKELRLEDIRAKGAYNRKDQTHLQEIVAKHVGIFADIRKALIMRANALQGRLPVFEHNPSKEADRASQAQSVLDKLKLPLQRLEQVEAKPFAQLRNAIASAYEELSVELHAGSRDGAKAALSKIFFATQVAAVIEATEGLRVKCVNPTEDLSAALLVAKTKLREVFDRQYLFKGEPTEFEKLAGPRSLRESVQRVGKSVVQAHAAYAEVIAREAKEDARASNRLKSRMTIVDSLDTVIEKAFFENLLS
jgi:hypothetical protein